MPEFVVEADPLPLAAIVSGASLFGGTSEGVRVQIPDARPVRRLTLTFGSSVTTVSSLTGPLLYVALPIPVVSSDETRVLVATVEDELGATVFSAPVSVTILADSIPRVTSSVSVGSPVSAGTSVTTAFTGVFRNPVMATMTLRVTGSVTYESTLIISIKKLKEIHTATHPSARLEPPKRNVADDELVLGSGDIESGRLVEDPAGPVQEG